MRNDRYKQQISVNENLCFGETINSNKPLAQTAKQQMEPPVNDNQRLPAVLQHSQSAVLVGKPQRAGTGPPPGQGDSPLAPLWVDSPPHQLEDIPMVGNITFLIICITSSQFSLLAALALHFWSHSLSIHIIFSTNSRSFLPVCFPSSLKPTPGFPPSTTQVVGLCRFDDILLSLSKAGYETSQSTVCRHCGPVQKTG